MGQLEVNTHANLGVEPSLSLTPPSVEDFLARLRFVSVAEIFDLELATGSSDPKSVSMLAIPECDGWSFQLMPRTLGQLLRDAGLEKHTNNVPM